MKKYITVIAVLVAAFSCAPLLEPEGQDPREPGRPAVESVALSSNALFLLPGEKASLTGTVYPLTARVQSVTWSSSNEGVVTVSRDGEVTAIAEGMSIITVNCDGKKDECAVTVGARRVPVTSVSLDRVGASLPVGETLQLTATVFPVDATDRTVTWTSSDTQVATVENGLVTALKAGRAVVTATSEGISATCTVIVSEPFSYGGLCMEAICSARLFISNPDGLTIEYKVESSDWISFDETEISILAKAGERVWFRGRNESYCGVRFRIMSGSFYLYGNIMSLMAGDEYEGRKQLTAEKAFYQLFIHNSGLYSHPTRDIELPATTLTGLCYGYMFYRCANLTRAPRLPARVLAERCYDSMFAFCSSLKEFPEMDAFDIAERSCFMMMRATGIEQAPELPAVNLARSCYEFMFMDCTELRKAMSVLPATVLAPNCYTGMFRGCEKLEDAPRLPATALAYCCYSFMFDGCSGLTTAPKLPATTLVEECYTGMFKGCTNLSSITCLATNISATYCTYDWLYNVAGTGTFTAANSSVGWSSGDNGIPNGWTRVNLN